jgi:DNA-binding transcriptional LysR family regulator
MMLGIGLGWGVLPKRLIDSQVKRLNVNQPAIHRPLGIIYHSQRSLSKAAESFFNLLKSEPIN